MSIREPSFISRAYDEWVKHEEAKRSYGWAIPAFRASDFGTCHRRMVLRRAGVEGRPPRVEKSRFFRHRILPHDDIVRGLRWAGCAVAREIDVTPGLPLGFSGHADILLHNPEECGCGLTTSRGHLAISWARLLNPLTSPSEVASLAIPLVRHEYVLSDVKTANPNIVNYSHKLPRAHNIAQLTAYYMGLRNLLPPFTELEWKISTRLIYVPMGEGVLLESDVTPDLIGFYWEVSRLRHEWDEYQTTGALPSVMPLQTRDSKDGPHRVVFRESYWQCSDQFCEFCELDGPGFCCNPVRPSVKSGERIAYLEPDGSVVYVRKWLEKLGLPVPEGAEIEDGPRPKEKAATLLSEEKAV